MSGTRRAALLLVVVVFGLSGPLLVKPEAATSNRVAVVVEHTDGTAQTHQECIRIPADGTNALFVLTRSSFPMYETSFQSGLGGRNLRWFDGEGYGTDVDPNYFNGADPSWALWTQRPRQADPRYSQVVLGSAHVDPGAVLYMQYARYALNSDGEFVQPAPVEVGFRSVCTG